MSEDQFRALLDGVRARFQAQLDREFATLSAEQGRAAADSRREIETELEARWAAKLDALRAEWASRLESERTAADTEAARRTLAERSRLTAELDAERHERQLLAAELDRSRAALIEQREAAERAMQQSSALAGVQVAERQAQLTEIDRLLGAVRTISAASSLSDTLVALLTSVAAEVPRAAVFIVNGSRLLGWKAIGFEDPPGGLQIDERDGSVLREALGRVVPVPTSVAPPPWFASLAPDRAGLAVPLVVGREAVSVLYADDGTAEPHASPAAWPEAVELLALHASEHLAQLTAVRTAQAMRQLVATAARAPAAGRTDDAGAARRYARLLISEIKLYNEAAVRQGRQSRDLLERLGTEIDRARQLYEERVPPTVASRNQYFDHELLQTLAGGDAALLGARA